MSSELLFLALLILVSGLFSAAETALTTLSAAKVKALAKEVRFGNASIVALKRNPQRLLITILISNTIVNIAASVVATLYADHHFGVHAVPVIAGILTLLLLTFGEIIPKSFAQKYSVRVSQVIAFPLLGLSRLLFPFIWLFEQMTHVLFSALKLRGPIQSMSEEELLALVDIGAKEGVIEEHEQELIENVLQFTDTLVGEVMTPKKQMEVLDIKTGVHDAVHFFLQHTHSRIPVYRDNLNNIIGIITVHDVLAILHDPKRYSSLEDFRFPAPILAPKTKPIAKLFHELQRRRQHIALVVDEHGETAGLVTMEDILEEIVGDIVDEQDREQKMVFPIGKNEWEAHGDATIEMINNALGVKLGYPEHQTVSLLILEQLHRFPKQGEKIAYENLILQVTELTKKKIERLHLSKLAMPGNPADEA